jgi:hypothetical protein
VSTILEGSRLNPQRLNTSDIFDSHSEQLDLNITEAALNELLTNITFSLVDLNLWTDDITVNATFIKIRTHFHDQSISYYHMPFA